MLTRLRGLDDEATDVLDPDNAGERNMTLRNKLSQVPSAILCLDGEPPSKKLLRQLQKKHRFVIAADGAANWLKKYGVTPNLIIGDFDGIERKILDSTPTEKIVHLSDQYSTDMEKALTWAIQNKFDQVTIVGFAGKRIDHTLSNFSLIWRYENKVDIEIEHDGWNAQLIRDTKKIFQVKKEKP